MLGKNLGEEGVQVTPKQGGMWQGKKQEEEEGGNITNSEYEENLGEEEVQVTPEQVEAQQGKVDKAAGRASHKAGNSQSTMIR